MTYFVVSTRRNSKEITICAKTQNSELASRLMGYWNTHDRMQFCEIHPVMDTDAEIENFLVQHSK